MTARSASSPSQGKLREPGGELAQLGKNDIWMKVRGRRHAASAPCRAALLGPRSSSRLPLQRPCSCTCPQVPLLATCRVIQLLLQEARVSSPGAPAKAAARAAGQEQRRAAAMAPED